MAGQASEVLDKRIFSPVSADFGVRADGLESGVCHWYRVRHKVVHFPQL